MIKSRAHGRVNLIGEHTDYNDGFVLPTLIPQSTSIELDPREDREVTIASHQIGESPVKYRLGDETRRDDWADYARGVTWVLARAGHRIQGFSAEIHSTVPIGSGLSSSAALEVALLRALSEAYTLKLGEAEIARLGQQVENDFVGARVGIMDQMASSAGEFGSALFLDTRDLSYRRVALPLDRADLLVINSGVAHRNVGGGYNERRQQCEESCRTLGLRALRDLTPAELSGIESRLPETHFRRVRHIVTENERVLAAVKALEARDVARLGELFALSHRSMRDDYEISCAEIDLLVEIAQAHPECLGARMTGGGFGGSIVALAAVGQGARVAAEISASYAERSGQKPTVLVPPPPEASV